MFTKRQLLALATAFAAPALAAGACTPTQATSDVQLISTGLAPILTNLVAAGVRVPQGTQDQINNELAILAGQAQAVTSVLSDKFSAATVTQAVGVIASLAQPFFVKAPLVAAAVEAAVLLANGLAQNAHAPAVAGARAGGLSLAQARMVLQASGAR